MSTTSSRPRAPVRTSILIAVVMAVALSGCTAAERPTAPAPGHDTPNREVVDSLLVVEGDRRSKDRRVDGEPPRERRFTIPRGPVLRALANRVAHNPWPALTLLPDGTIDGSSETPFTDQPLSPQPSPVEDDPSSTKVIDDWAERLRRIDRAEWDQRTGNGANSPFARKHDQTMDHIVRIAVQRCGGARTVSTGVVVGPETVVTTVHAIESASLRVRVSPAKSDPTFIPAMVRYLDVDDDVAVLRVPGLNMVPIGLHAPNGTDPEWGYAYGVGNGGPGGTMRREPAVVAMQEAKLAIEQPDGFARQIRDRSVFSMVAPVGAGFSGGVVTATNGPIGTTDGWELHGLIRARMPMRGLNAGIVVPARIVREAVAASRGLPAWFEHRAGGCPQWHR